MRLTDALALKPGDVVSVAGAGGKTTLLLRLAQEARADGLRVLLTSTTHMGGLAESGVPLVLESEGEAEARIDRALDSGGCVLLLGERLREDKLRGLAPERVDRLAGRADLLLVEADGARRRSLKAPGPQEPVLASKTTLLLVVAGLDVLGLPFAPEAVHRFEVASALSGGQAGRAIDEGLFAAVLGHPDSYPSRRPRHARLALLLNKAELPGAEPAAARLGAPLAPPYDRVVAGSAAQGWAHRVA